MDLGEILWHSKCRMLMHYKNKKQEHTFNVDIRDDRNVHRCDISTFYRIINKSQNIDTRMVNGR